MEDHLVAPEPAPKTIGRRRTEVFDWEDVDRLQRTMGELRGSPDLVPRGVYRFASFEEADEWMIQAIASTRVRRRSKTLPVSATR